ncbi:hypothetical protein HHI36_011893 [Cryptolaemus montrouzieri]|uniref:Modular serine protease-like n=1 Tax=Cryptolaemus montrouzieri TaxID=559131 RepID=A0ABD2NCQ0_9CUCU
MVYSMLSVINSVLWVNLILSVLGDYIDNGFIELNQTNTRSSLQRQRRATCDGFECKQSHDCIDQDKYCDGPIDCPDGSDETNACQKLRCSSYLFRCSYGACINPLFECDGKKDCADGSDENTPKCKDIPSSKGCKDGEFRCNSGQCINGDNKCDGIPHCTDQSDETAETCLRFPCPGYTFKCKYGACVSRRGVCNGISECFDDSDEDPNLCRNKTTVKPVTPPVTPRFPDITPATPSPPLGPGSCTLPNIENGKFNILGEMDGAAGESVAAGTILTISCGKGYIAIPDHTLSHCNAGQWSPSLPICKQICPAFKSTEDMTVTCRYNGAEISCNAAVDHTQAEFKCKAYHKLSTIESVRYCFEGTWNEEKPTCKPVCGEKRVNPKTLIIGGQIVKRGNYPWTIAIYKRKTDGYRLVCGGSLINQRVIVTAAHCVTDKEGDKLDKSLYRVAAGKYYLAYDDSKDTDAEFSEIKEIHTHVDYKGTVYDYDNDIAVLVTKEAFNITEFIQRVCMDFNQLSLYEVQLLGTNGTVTGWGYTVRGGKQSEVLKELSVPYVDHTKCYQSVPYDYRKYVKSNRICAGYIGKGEIQITLSSYIIEQ